MLSVQKITHIFPLPAPFYKDKMNITIQKKKKKKKEEGKKKELNTPIL